MPEGDLSSSKSKAAAAFTLLSPTPSTTEQPVSCLRHCETSFAPEQQPSASTDNENPNMMFKISYDITMISQSAKSLLLIFYCLSFLDSASISHQVTAWGDLLHRSRKMPTTRLCGNFRTKSVSCIHLKGMACLLTPLQGPSTSA